MTEPAAAGGAIYDEKSRAAVTLQLSEIVRSVEMNLTPISNSSWALHTPVTPIHRLCSGGIRDVNQVLRCLWRGSGSGRELDCNPTVAAGGLMASPILGRTGHPFLLVVYALIGLSLWTVDREIGGRSSQPISVISNPDTASSGSPHGEIIASFVLPQNDKLYRPASSVLDQLGSHEPSSAESSDKDHDKRHRAAVALMVYLSTDGIKR